LSPDKTIDTGENFIDQLMLYQLVTKPKNGTRVRWMSMRVHLGKITVQPQVKEGFLHRRVRQAGLLRQEMRAQHYLQRKRGAAGGIQGTTHSTCSVNSRLRVFLAFNFNSRLACFMDFKNAMSRLQLPNNNGSYVALPQII